MMIPEIQTDRLLLRGHNVGDLDACAAMWSDEAVVRFIGGRIFSREECWARLQRYVGHWALFGFGFWAVTDKASGECIGELGFADFKREMEPNFHGAMEAGWAFSPVFHGKGLALEALSAGLSWAHARFGAQRVCCMIDPDNAASIKLARKVGFAQFAQTDYRGAPSLLFEMTL